MTLSILIFALAATGSGISGGDRIFIEFSRRWSKHHFVKIHTSSDGQRMCQRQKLSGKYLQVKKIGKTLGGIFLINYLYKIYLGIKLGLSLKLQGDEFLYSASDFWMDFLPALILKLRYHKTTWIACWLQTAPNPLKGYTQGERENSYRKKALLYWLVQLSTKPLVSRLADFVLVNNDEERKQFPNLDSKGKVIVVLGAIDLDKINNFKRLNPILPTQKKYDGVFQGRFHPQKGVIELVDIWKLVVNKKPSAKLVMIGDGPLRKNVELRIKNLGLTKNVKLMGYLFDGPQKYKIFSESKIVLHPAFYDSGGMAAAEAMAFGLPAIGFNLPAFGSYYPKGMAKVRIGDLKAFGKEILKLLEDKRYYQRLSQEATDMIEKSWDWDKRAAEVLGKIGSFKSIDENKL